MTIIIIQLIQVMLNNLFNNHNFFLFSYVCSLNQTLEIQSQYIIILPIPVPISVVEIFFLKVSKIFLIKDYYFDNYIPMAIFIFYFIKNN